MLLFFFLLNQFNVRLYNSLFIRIFFLCLGFEAIFRCLVRQLSSFDCSAGTSFGYRYSSLGGICNHLSDICASQNRSTSEFPPRTRSEGPAFLRFNTGNATSFMHGDPLATKPFPFGQETFTGVALQRELHVLITKLIP